MTELRSPEPDEAATLAALHVQTWQEAYAGLLPEAYLTSLSPTQRLPMWQRLLAAPERSATLVAERGGRAIGFACGGAARDGDATTTTGEMWMIYVLRAFWGQGTGRDLHDALLRELHRRGYELATLWVLESNARTRRWYERQGWTPDGRRRSEEVWGATVSEVGYRKLLVG